jgi:cbb3-type cytochrome oxidase maturation protein
VSFLLLTIPVTLLISAVLLLLVLRSVRDGQYEDWEGPAWRMLYDDDRQPEIEGVLECDAGDERRTT